MNPRLPRPGALSRPGALGGSGTPLERHPALHDLSRDHHQILVICAHVDVALDEGTEVFEPEEAAADLARAWTGDLPAHFREEEAVLLPALARRRPAGEVEPVPILRDDHAWLRGRLDDLVDAVAAGEAAAELAGEVAHRLRRHVTLEERRLFPNLEALLDEDELKALGEASRAYREEHRGLAAVGP